MTEPKTIPWTDHDYQQVSAVTNKLRSVHLMASLGRADQETWSVLDRGVRELDIVIHRVGEAVDDGGDLA